MFGYVKSYKPELKIKEMSFYKSAYCALCDQLKRDYGFIGRFVLSYDITFLLLCLNHFEYDDKEKRKIRCPYSPTRVKKVTLSKEALQYSAFINYWLVIQKLFDDYIDERNIIKSFFRKILISKKRYKDIRICYGDHINRLEDSLHVVYMNESDIKDSFDFDRITNAFGYFFAEIFTVIKAGEEDKVLLNKLFFQIGKWIYIIDAYDDFEKDRQKNKFNLLLSLKNEADMSKETVFEKTLSLHFQLKQKIDILLDQLKSKLDEPCVINILSYGLDNVFYEITNKKYKEFVERLTEYGSNSLGYMDKQNK
ncbi:MAG: hypothetical protein IJA55_03570 [Clostridia bacterium]|nr:hypothetical protein [Clostridia bacterium]